jgi:hypothetical protein
MKPKVGIVISHYEKRDKSVLKNLLSQFQQMKENLVVVINRDNVSKESSYYADGTIIVERPNLGMNIGGWSSAIKYCRKFDYVIFMQDECEIVDFAFLEHYSNLLNNDQIGMVGESINPKWVYSWEVLKLMSINYQLPSNTEKSITRIDLYHKCFDNWGIKHGNSGHHLRALVWGFKNDVLQKNIEQFPLGMSKEECIAAEIGVSKLVEQYGLRVIQSNERPFCFIRHKEWRQDGWSKKLT